MGNISNRFYVTALEDGTTLHGNLVADKSLTQAWNGTSATPDWTVAAKQPTIYLTLLSGATSVQPSNTYDWYYNGNLIVFDGTTNQSTSQNGVPAGVFLKTTHGSPAMPALKIIGNLAGNSNVDVDMITFKGRYTINTSAVEFSCDAQIRISRMTSNGYLGVLNFVDGVSDITTPNQNIKIWAELYGGADGTEVAPSGYTVKWYVNDTLIQSATPAGTQQTTYTPTGGTAHQALQLNENDVTDHTVVTCEFTKDGNIAYTAYVGVDDMQDPEFMYIQYNGNNGNAASLRKNETVRFFIWIGKREDPNVDTSFAHFKIKLLDGNGSIITDTVSGWPNPPDAKGWRIISNREDNKAYIDITYAQATTYFKNLTGIIMASTSSFT